MDESLKKARELFNVAHIKEVDCRQLIQQTEGAKDIVLMGYHASALMVLSKYSINPFKILKIFNEGREILEDLISENFDAVELRFLRYTIQLNTPKFVGYYRNIDSDRDCIEQYLKQNPTTALTQHMMIFLKDTKDVIVRNLGL